MGASESRGPPIYTEVHIADRATFDSAEALIRAYGEDAGLEAAARAEHSRDMGNILHFCRWRLVERLILLMTTDDMAGTIH